MLVEGGKSSTSLGRLFKETYSTALLIFCTILVTTSIFTENTTIAANLHPWAAFIILWIAIIWLSMVEGGQASFVGLPPVNMNLYKNSHPTTHKIMETVKTGDGLDQYLMGRQFMVLALVFLENLCAHPLDEEKSVLGMPHWVNQVFLSTGLGIFFMTAMLGKISAQVNASRCMLDYVNNPLAHFTFLVAMAIEFSGLLHCCYLVQKFFAWASGKPLEQKGTPRTVAQNAFFWGRVLVSTAILAFSFAVTLSALFNDQTTMWDAVPAVPAVILFFAFMALVGMLEGMQIAFFAIACMTDEERAAHPWAKRTCDVLFQGEGRNLPGFMVGRQMCVTLCFFIVARVTTVKLNEGDDNIFGVSDGLQAFLETGLLGALITTIVASITWQLVASAFPMAFLSTPLTYVLLRFCLLLEWTGLCQGSWVVARIHRRVAGFKQDEVYIGTADERAKQRKGEDPEGGASAEAGNEQDGAEYNTVKPGHLYPRVNGLSSDVLDFMPPMRTLEEIKVLELELVEHKQDVENRLKQLEVEKCKLQEKAQ